MGIERIKKVYEKKAEKRERFRQIIIKDIFKVLEKLRDEVSFEEAYIFGSLAEPYQFKEHSDIDFAFKGLDRDRLFYVVGFMSSPLDRDVNTVHIEDIHFKGKIMGKGIKWKRK